MEQKVDNEKKLIRRGSFRIAYKNEGKLIIILGAAVVLCIAMMILGLVLNGTPHDFLGFMLTFFWLIPAVVSVVCIPVIMCGRRCSYNAGEDEFEIKRLDGSDYLYYTEISEVIYTPSYLFGKERGFLVTVVTNVRDFTFRYLFDSKEQTESKHTPFYVLEINSGLRTPEGKDPELAAAIISQFAAMQEKQVDRLSKKPREFSLKKFFMGGDD